MALDIGKERERILERAREVLQGSQHPLYSVFLNNDKRIEAFMPLFDHARPVQADDWAWLEDSLQAMDLFQGQIYRTNTKSCIIYDALLGGWVVFYSPSAEDFSTDRYKIAFSELKTLVDTPSLALEFTGILELSNDFSVVCDERGHCLYANHVARDFLQLSVLGCSSSEGTAAIAPLLEAASTSSIGERLYNYQTATLSGPQYWYFTKQTFRSLQDEYILLYGVEVTARVQETSALQSLQERAHQLFNYAKDLIYMYPLLPDNTPGRLVDVNDTACTTLGYTREEMLNKTVFDFVHPSMVNVLIDSYRELSDKGHLVLFSRQVKKDGSILPVEVSLSLVNLRHIRYVLSVSRDISDRLHLESRLHAQAHFDDLTGFPNLRWLRNRIDTQIDRLPGAGFFAVLAIGMDGFKVINDAYGSAVADQVLVTLCHRLQTIGLGGVIGRIVGDELLFVPDGWFHDESEVLAIVERIQASVFGRVTIGQYAIHVTACVGIAAARGLSEDISSTLLIERATTALHTAKSKGTSMCEWYADDLLQPIKRKHELYLDCIKAIRCRDIEVFYQPRWTASGQLVGAEALARWQRDGEWVSPDVFISMAEEMGLMERLGFYLLSRILHDIAYLRCTFGETFKVSMNVSIHQLNDDAFTLHLLNLLDTDPTLANCLEIEVTESMFMESGKHMPRLVTLQEAGYRILIDDFGTGYSSLRYLQEMVPTAIKLDYMFTKNIGSLERTRQIVDSVLLMAKRIGMSVVAEGVETEAQRAWLVDRGCDEMQGYLLGKPMTLSDLLAYQTACDTV